VAHLNKQPVEHPAAKNARLAVELEAERFDSDERRQMRIFWKIIMLSPDLETCEALLRGQKVPRHRFDPTWFQRFGLK
jgi:hypothetical protein